MADISQEDLKKEITAILKDAELSTLTGKKVRQQIEEKLDIDLSSRRKEVDELVMECLQEKKDKSKKKNGSAKDASDDEEEEDEEEDDEEDEEEEEKPKRSAKKPAPKRKQASSDESEDASEEDKDDDYSPSKKKAKAAKKPAKKAGRKSAKGSESDSDEDWGKKKKAAPKKGGGRGGGGYTKALKLSPELSELMGEDAMPRHEVVKKIWALIKEKNLYDPKNKQFAICNDELFKVFGVKRFRTFGMMKLLKDHFIPS
ncbi:unnamed protein product [Bemisia tabaci]|uniref:Upstream activation factor subunit spp27 n=2 Tax=Bemisia tabaci TaxID=7038 RepID=A0A9P0FB32_BEMTA|nr:PREDICTED: upstream activation factor subunit spp27 [Bemisia tabaci]CAH0396226.1 unnamed protein product [Bemisia tabaci]CAH0396230.1 unnamed protein product [Bemisia tabaci]